MDKAIAWLEANGYLRVTRGGGRRIVNRYELALTPGADARVDRALGNGKGRSRARVSPSEQPHETEETAARRAQESAAREEAEHCYSNAERIARAVACAFCGATSSPEWSWTHRGRVCGHHSLKDRDYVHWANQRTEDERGAVEEVAGVRESDGVPT